MIVIYAMVGVFLIIIGLLSSTYFTLHIKKTRYKKCCISHLLDGLGALFLGFFYIYSYIELKGNLRNTTTTLIFQEDTYLNVSEEPTILNFFPTLPNAINHLPSTNDVPEGNKEVFTELAVTTENITILNQDSISDHNEEITMIPLIDNLKNGSFNFYQNFFKDIIKQKTSNNSKLVNRTIFYNNKEYGKSIRNNTKLRMKREPKEYITPDIKCFKEMFLKHALLICSFLYSVICLINNIKVCYEHKPQNSITLKKEINEESLESSRNSKSSQSSLFVRKNEKLARTMKFSIEDKNKKNELDKEAATSSFSRHSTYILKLIILWFSPGFCVFSLHIIMGGPNVQHHSIYSDPAYNFTSIAVSKDLIKLINNPPSVIIEENNKEINDIVQNVYNIVDEISKQPNINNQLIDDIIYDTIYYLNKKHENMNNTNGCSFNTSTLKIHSFFLFCIIFIGSIFYSKILQIKMKLEENIFSHFTMIYFYVYILIWLPCICEVLFRIYILDRNPSAISDITLALANLFIVVNNFNNYLLLNKIRKTCLTLEI
ncbi:uncharacterized protein LOC123679030 [Harmonia axyridis]|uniref:uncharacterized protein LOC123679030 n=1 Tax=Harmonia axyridis TaxID=115357 RepID=UPI001E27627B|nr:uncharacterized protein LOC123679030 [Harmonia axyridis]